MRRRDVPKALFATTASAALIGARAQAQAGSPQPAFPGDVTLFGADPTGKEFCDKAIEAALAAQPVVYFPAGFFKVAGPIRILGSRTLLGPPGSPHAMQPALINHVPSKAGGNLFELGGDHGGGACIANLHVTGGRGGFVIVSNRQQSVFENLYMEATASYGFDANGIRLTACDDCSGDPPAGYNYGSWDTTIRNCKWVAPRKSDYRGYVIATAGGKISLENCVAERGVVGFDVERAEAVVFDRVLAHNQNRDFAATPSAGGQFGIRLRTAISSRAISINAGYFEGCSLGVWAEQVRSLDIANSFFDDLGYGGNAIRLADASVICATIRNCTIRQRSRAAAAIENHGTRTFVGHTTIEGTDPNVIALDSTTRMHTLDTHFTSATVKDTGGMVYDLDCDDVDLALGIAGDAKEGAYPIAVQQSSCTRMGRRVWIDIDIALAASIGGGGSGNLCISGLPVAPRSAGSPLGNAEISGTGFSGPVTLGFAPAGGDARLRVFRLGSNGASEPVPASAMVAGSRIRGSICYRV